MTERIIIAKSEIGHLHEFSHLMDKTTQCLNDVAQVDKSFCQLNGIALESVVFDKMKTMCSGTSFRPEDMELKSGQGFPDIITRYLTDEKKFYGVEVKTTKEDKWKTTGSSIVESTRIPNVDNIFLLFGKIREPRAEFKCRPYEQCLSDIAVTHSPRYLIDMNLGVDENIFAKMNTDYESFRSNGNCIPFVRKYYKDLAKAKGKTEMPWWMEDATSVNLQFIADIDKEKRSELISRGIILFPEIAKGDYKRFSLWLCTRHSIISPYVRDHFSAGGCCVAIDGDELCEPCCHIVGTVIEHSQQIVDILENIDSSFYHEVLDAWQCEPSPDHMVELWLGTIYKHLPKLKDFEDIILSRKQHILTYTKTRN